MVRYLIYLLFIVFIGCAPSPSSSIFEDVDPPFLEDDNGDDSASSGYAPVATHSIYALKSKYIGSTAVITESMVVEGRVVANDIRDEFINTVILEDDSGAIEVSIYLDNISATYPLGSTVRLLCDGLWIGSRGGTLVVGYEPTDDSVVDTISESDLPSRLYFVEAGSLPTPTTIDLSQLTTSMVSRYVRVDGVRFQTTAGSRFCDRDPDSGLSISTTHIIEDEVGRTAELFILSRTDYADEPVPDGYGTIFVIVELYGNSYSLRPIDRGFMF